MVTSNCFNHCSLSFDIAPVAQNRRSFVWKRTGRSQGTRQIVARTGGLLGDLRVSILLVRVWVLSAVLTSSDLSEIGVGCIFGTFTKLWADYLFLIYYLEDPVLLWGDNPSWLHHRCQRWMGVYFWHIWIIMSRGSLKTTMIWPPLFYFVNMR